MIFPNVQRSAGGHPPFQPHLDSVFPDRTRQGGVCAALEILVARENAAGKSGRVYWRGASRTGNGRLRVIESGSCRMRQIQDRREGAGSRPLDVSALVLARLWRSKSSICLAGFRVSGGLDGRIRNVPPTASRGMIGSQDPFSAEPTKCRCSFTAAGGVHEARRARVGFGDGDIHPRFHGHHRQRDVSRAVGSFSALGAGGIRGHAVASPERTNGQFPDRSQTDGETEWRRNMGDGVEADAQADLSATIPVSSPRG